MRQLIIFIIYLLAWAPVAGVHAGSSRQAAEADSCYLAGEACYARRQYAAAMAHYLDGLRACEQPHLHATRARIYIGIGNLYSSQNDYEMGIHFYEEALRLAHRHGERTLENKVLNNLVGANCFAGHIRKGLHYYRLMEANKESSDDFHMNLLMGKALIANSMQQPQQALGLYHKALAFARSRRMDPSYAVAAYSCLAQLHADLHQPDSALHYLKLNEGLARHSGQTDLLAETLRQMADAYTLKGDRRQATDCKLEYVDLWDSIYSKEDFYAMKNAQYLYDAAQSSHTIHSLTREKALREQQVAMQRRWIMTLAVGFAVFVILLAVVYRQKSQLRQAYNDLFDRSQAYLTSGDTPAPQLPQPSLLTPEQRTLLLDHIRRVMETTEEICHSDFNIDRLAALTESNSRYVSEAINEGYGKNFRTVLNEYRIKEAMRRLRDTEHYGGFTIKAISESVGYKSQANFITVFTKVTGMKPSIYQKISKERQ